MSGIGKLFKKAQFIKDNYSALSTMRDQMKKTQVTGESGRGAVKVNMDGTNTVTSVVIDPGLAQPGSVEKLQRLLMEAFNDAQQKAQKSMQGAMKNSLSGMDLGGLKDML